MKLFFVSLLCCVLVEEVFSIVGGEDAFSNGQFPFAAAITVQTSDSKYFCGGTLYSNQFVITAGQCVDGAVLFTINLGTTKLSETEETRITVATSEYFIHPDYNPLTLEHDVGVIRFRAPIEFTDYIKSIVLPTSDIGDGFYTRVFGWGQTTDSSSALASVLQYVFTRTLSNVSCKVYYGNQITDNMVCAVGDYNEGLCHGDTGGGLLNFNSFAQNTLAGIASFISGNGCETIEPSGFTRTFGYVDWIKNVTETE